MDNLGLGRSSESCIQSAEQFGLAKWSHLAVSYEAATGQGRIYLNGLLKAIGTLPPPTPVARCQTFWGRGLPAYGNTVASFMMDTIRIWSLARSGTELKASMFQEVYPPTAGLEYQTSFEEGQAVEYFMNDTSGNALNVVMPATPPCGSAGLQCRSRACRVPVDISSRVVCGDAVRTGAEECDDGNFNSADGCSATCQVEPGWVCRGGEDLLSSDSCEKGEQLFAEDFESADAAAWNWQANRGAGGASMSWDVSPAYKFGGEYGMRLRVNDPAADPQGCPFFIGNNVFRGGAHVTRHSNAQRAAVVPWASASLPGIEPGGSGYVLQLGTSFTSPSSTASYTAHERRTDVARIQTVWDKMLWPVGSRGETYTLTAQVFVENTWDATNTDILRVSLLAADGTTVRASTAGKALIPGVRNQWTTVSAQLESTMPVASVAFAIVGESHTTGRMFITGLQITRVCPGLPPGPLLWNMADAGTPQEHDARVSLWEDQSLTQSHGESAGAARPRMVVNHDPSRHTPGTWQANAEQYMQDVGLPAVENLPNVGGMRWRTSDVSLNGMPGTLCVVDKRSVDDASESPALRYLLQSPTFRGSVGSTSSWRSVESQGYRIGNYVYGTSYNGDSLNYMFYWGITCMTMADDRITSHVGGSYIGQITSSYYAQPWDGLAMGASGFFSTQVARGQVAEIISYGRELTDGERQNVEMYLAHKWGAFLGGHFSGNIHPETYQWVAYNPNTALAVEGEGTGGVPASQMLNASSDAVYPAVLRRGKRQALLNSLGYGRRTIASVNINSTTLLSFSVRVRLEPFYMGAPLWMLVGDAGLNNVPANHPCFTVTEQCDSIQASPDNPAHRKFVRICVNGANELGMCDEITTVPVDKWARKSFSLKTLFNKKYGQGATLPTGLTVVLAGIAPQQSSEVYVDDLRLVNVGTDKEPLDCPGVEVVSRGGASRVLRPTKVGGVQETGWQAEQAASGGIAATVTAVSGENEIHMAGTVDSAAKASVDVRGIVTGDARSRVEIVSEQQYSVERTYSFDLSIDANTAASASSHHPSIHVCDNQLRLQYDHNRGHWRYLALLDSADSLPTNYDLYTPPDLAPSTEFDLGTERIWDNANVENWHVGGSTYSFWVKNTPSSSYSSAMVFMRGCNTSYTEFDLGQVSGSSDAQPKIEFYTSTRNTMRFTKAGHFFSHRGCSVNNEVPANEWVHVAMTLLPDPKMKVYYNGVQQCNYNMNSEEIYSYLITDAGPRKVGFGYCGSRNPFVSVRDFRHYDTPLSDTQVRALFTQESSLPAQSMLTPDSAPANLMCRMTHDAIHLYENGVLKVNKSRLNPIEEYPDSAVASHSDTPLRFIAMTNSGSTAGFRLTNLRVAEQREDVLAPKLCPDTGKMYQFVRTGGLTYTQARDKARKTTLRGVQGRLAAIQSADEMQCIKELLSCQRAWISGYRSGADWLTRDGEAKAVETLTYLPWASNPAPAGSTGHLMVHPIGCTSGEGGLLGQVGECGDSCALYMQGYVVEHPLPQAQALNFLSASLGATLSNSPGFSASTASPTAVLAESHVLGSGDESELAGWTFAAGSGQTTQTMEFDIGSARGVNRVGVEFDQREAPPGAQVVVSVKLASGAAWSSFGALGALSDAGDINRPSVFVSGEMTSVRYVRFQFAGHSAVGNTDPIRVGRVFAGQALETFGQIKVRGTAVEALSGYDPEFSGLKVAVMHPDTGEVASVHSMPLTGAGHAEAVESLLAGLPTGSAVAMAAQNLPSVQTELMQESFGSFLQQNSIRRSIVPDGTNSYSFMVSMPNATWSEAADMCYQQKAALCSQEDLCYGYSYGSSRYNGYLWSNPNPHPSSQYVALAGENTWMFGVYVYTHTSRYRCQLRSEVVPTEPNDDAFWRGQIGQSAACCRSHSADVPSAWSIHREGTRDTYWNAGDAHPSALFYLSTGSYFISGSQLLSSGLNWGHPLLPNVASAYFTDEEQYARVPTNPQTWGGVHAYYNDVAAKSTWSNYVYRVRMQGNDRHLGVLFRMSAPNTYYAIYALVQSGSEQVCLFRSNAGTPTPCLVIIPTSSPLLPERSVWHAWEVQVSGNWITFSVDGAELFHYEDTSPDALSTGTVGVTSWFSQSNRIDDVQVTLVSDLDTAALQRAFKHIGISSASSILSSSVPSGDMAATGSHRRATLSWTAMGRKQPAVNASEPSFLTAAVQVASAGEVATISSLFACRSQNVTLPENSALLAEVNAPLALQPGADIGGFFIVGARAGDPFVVDSATGGLVVKDQEPLDFETQQSFSVSVAAKRAFYESGWVKFGSQAGTMSFMELQHTVELDPASLDVDLLVRATEGANKGFIMHGTGAMWAQDYTTSYKYGGVHFGYSRGSVRMWAPSRDTAGSGGSIWRSGDGGWGGRYEAGRVVEEMWHQISHLAEVQIVVSPLVTPAFDSGWFTGVSQKGTSSNYALFHGIGDMPDRVRVLVKFLDGPNKGFVFEAVSSAQTIQSFARFGAVLYAYDEDEVRVWLPVNANTYGFALRTGDGWGGRRHASAADIVAVRVQAWKEDLEAAAPAYTHPPFTMHPQSLAFAEIKHNVGLMPGRVQVIGEVRDGASRGFYHDMKGVTAQATGFSWRQYGGINYAYNETHLRLWTPSRTLGATWGNGQMIIFAGGNYAPGQTVQSQLTTVRNTVWADVPRQVDTVRTTINLLNVEEPPLASGIVRTLPENTADGTSVADLQVTDGDCPDMSLCSLTFSLIAGDLDGVFDINPTTGNVFVKNNTYLNYEYLREQRRNRTNDDRAMDGYIAVVVNVDDGRLSSQAMVYMEITDENDPPVMELNPVRSVVEESMKNTKVGAAIFGMDEDDGQLVTFSILDGNFEDTFAIGTCSGQIRVLNPPDYETRTVFDLTIMAIDDGVPPTNLTTNVHIDIINKNDPPEADPQEVFVYENGAVGQPLAIRPANATDQDGDPLIWRVIVGDDTQQFTLQSLPPIAGGISPAQVLTTKPGLLDFESPTLNSFQLLALVNDTEYTVTTLLTITVLDLNDAPRVPVSSQALLVAEMAPFGVEIGTVAASDQDGDTLTFTLVTAHPSAFTSRVALDPSTGRLTVTPAGAGIFNFETEPTFLIEVEVSDDGGRGNAFPPMATRVNLTVRVDNVNEPPMWHLAGQASSVAIQENAVPGRVIATFAVTDPDLVSTSFADQGLSVEFAAGNENAANGAPVSPTALYAALAGAGGASAALGLPFGVTLAQGYAVITDPANPPAVVNTSVTLASVYVANDVIDFESIQQYQLTLRVSDNDIDAPLTASIGLQVNITDRNDRPLFRCNSSVYTAYSQPWQMHQGWGFETTGGLTLDSPEFTWPNPGAESPSEQPFGPQFRSDHLAASSCETSCRAAAACHGFVYFSSQHPQTQYRRQCFFDTRPGYSLPVYEKLIEGFVYGGAKHFPCNRVRISEHSAAGTHLSTVTSLDDEEDDVDLFLATVGSQDLPSGASAVNRGPQSTFLDSSAFSVQQFNSSTNGTDIVTVTYNATLHQWELSVASTAAINFETQPQSDSTIWVQLDAVDALGSNTSRSVWLAVELIDENDQPQVDVNESLWRLIPEATPAGTSFGAPLLFRDEDFDDVLSYEVLHPAGSNFTIGSSSGILATSQLLPDLSDSVNETFKVRVNDTQGGSVTVDVIVTISSFNKAPVLNNPAAVRRIPELSPAGTFVVPTLQGSDGDGHSLVYLVENITPKLLSTQLVQSQPLDSTSIQLVSNSSVLSHEFTPVITLRVTVTDQPSDPSFATSIVHTLQILVDDVNEAPDSGLQASFNVDENTPPGSVLGNFTWRDPDETGAPLSLTLLSHSILFDLEVVGTSVVPASTYTDASLAATTAGTTTHFLVKLRSDVAWDALDFETANPAFTLNIDAFDGALTSTGRVEIAVNDIWEAPECGIRVFTVQEQNEDREVILGDLAVRDDDLTFAGTSSLRLTILTNTADRFDRNMFGLGYDTLLDRHQLILLRASRPDFEDLQQATAEILVQDATGLRGRCNVIVNITDLNDLTVTAASLLRSGAEVPPTDMNTAGGETLVLQGTNFGFTAEWHAARPVLARAVPVVTYGGADGRKYTAQGCYVLDTGTAPGNNRIVCNTAVGVGAGLRVRVSMQSAGHLPAFNVSAPPMALSSAGVTIHYGRPALSMLSVGSFAGVPTPGGQQFTVNGTNLGPGTSDPAGTVTVQYQIPPDLTPLYTAAACFVSTPHTAVTCTVVPGVGLNHTFVAAVAGQVSEPVKLLSSFSAPAIASVRPGSHLSGTVACASDLGTAVTAGEELNTDGSDPVTIEGSNFGPLGGSHVITAAYGPTGAEFRIDGSACQLVCSHTRVVCQSLPGIGGNHVWSVNVAGTESIMPSVDTSSYTPPAFQTTVPGDTQALMPIATADDETQASSTRGGVSVPIAGTHFGPATISLPESLSVTYRMRYGDFVVPNTTAVPLARVVPAAIGAWNTNPTQQYESTQCLVPVPGLLECSTIPGTGFMHDVQVGITVCAADGVAACFTMWTTGVALNSLHYAAPILGQVLGDGAESATQGGEEVTLFGANFGPAGAARIQFVEYKASEEDGNEVAAAYPTRFLAVGCNVTEAHTQMACRTCAGAGGNLRWTAVIDGQRSRAPTNGYMRPTVTQVTAERAGVPVATLSTGGGDTLVIDGLNFGASIADLRGDIGSITYGPSSATRKFICSNVTIVIPHSRLSCLTAPGVGTQLRVVVTVATQRSTSDGSSGVVVQYDIPRVFSLTRVALAALEGNSTKGSDLFRVTGINFGYFGERPRVLFIENIPGGRTQEAVAVGAVSTTSIQFLTPTGVGRDVSVLVSVAGVHSNAFAFHYSKPHIPDTGVSVLDEIAQVQLGLPVISTTCTLVDITGWNFGTSSSRNFLRVAPTSADLTVEQLKLVPGVTGSAGEMLASTIACGLPATQLIWDHSRVRVALPVREGRLWIQTGEQHSSTQFFTNTNPSVRSVTVLGDAVTAGGFKVQIDATNLGSSAATAPQIRTFFRAADGSLSYCGVVGAPAPYSQAGSPSPALSFATIVDSGKVILGRIVCDAPEGEGPVEVLVVPSSADLLGNNTSPVTLGATGNLTYLPPSIAAFGRVGGTTEQDRLAEQSAQALIAGDTVLIKGSNFGLNPTVTVQDWSQTLAGGVPFWSEVLPVQTRTHSQVSFVVPDWVGTEISLFLSAGGQVSTEATQLRMAYRAPEFTAIEMARYFVQNGQQVRTVVDAVDTRGGEEMVISGRGFGPHRWPPGSPAAVPAAVTVGGRLLFCPASTWNTTHVTCFTAQGSGACLQVQLTSVRGTANTPPPCTAAQVRQLQLQSSTPGAISYKHPAMQVGTALPVLPTTGTMRQVDVFSSALGSDSVLFGQYVAAAAAVWPELYGSTLFLPGSVNMGPAVATVRGTNFATGGELQLVNNNSAAVFSAQHVPSSGVTSPLILHWNHTAITFLLPPGAGGPLHLRIITGPPGFHLSSAGGPGAAVALSYLPPTILPQTEEPTSPTDGCYQFLEAENGNLDTCCRPATVRLTGSNFGLLPSGAANAAFPAEKVFGVRVDGRTVVSRRCSDLRLGSSMPQLATNGALCPADCLARNSFTGECETYRGAVSRIGQVNGEGCCRARYDYTDSVVASSAFCQCRVPRGACIISWDHDEVVFRPPPGFGKRVPLEVISAEQVGTAVGGAPSDLSITYDEPRVSYVQPQPVDAMGGTRVTLYGKNFGASRQAVNVTLNEFKCETPEWLLGPTGPYIECTMPVLKVGLQTVNVTLGGSVTGSTPGETGVMYTRCVPGFFGISGEYCITCKIGANCSSFDNDLETPWSEAGWWRTMLRVPNSNCHPDRTTNLRSECPHYIPCEPRDSCAGNNTCTVKYTGERCALCSVGHYRLGGECIECPENAWLLIVLGVCAAALLGFVAYNLNKREVHTGVASIIVDYFQVLALFSRSKVPWPMELLQLFRFMSIFSFNLELTAPECSVPDLEYSNKWFGTILLPILAITLFGIMHIVILFYKRCLKGRKKNLNRHLPTLISTTLMMLYFLYLHLTRTIFDVFNCNPTDPPDGNLYLEVVFEECGTPGGTQMRLLPYAIPALMCYTVGYPLVVMWVFRKNAVAIQSDIVLMAMKKGENRGENPHGYDVRKKFKRLYYIYSYEYYWWNLVIILRKLAIALSGLMFRRNPAFQLAMVLLVLFASFTVHIIHKPYVGKMEWPTLVAKYWEGIKKGSSKEKAIEKLLMASSVFDRRKIVKKTSKLGDETDLDRGQDADRFWQEKGWVKFLIDYNIVESILLTCSVVVCVSGIMFQSGQLDSEGTQFAAQRTALLAAVMLTIVGSILYIAVVGYGAVAGDKAFQCMARSKSKDPTAQLGSQHAVMRQEREKRKAGGTIEMNNNPILLSASLRKKLKGSDLPNSNPPPALWSQIRTHYANMEETLDQLERLQAKAEQHRLNAEFALEEADAARKDRKFARRLKPGEKPKRAVMRQVAATRSKDVVGSTGASSAVRRSVLNSKRLSSMSLKSVRKRA